MRKKALLIGVDHYANIEDLKFCAQDAEAVKDSLIAHYDFHDDEIVLMTTQMKEDRYPNRGNILAKFNELLDDRLDLLTIGYWGHGFRSADGKRYLCDPNSSERNLKGTALALELVLGYIRQIRAATTVLLLDCCQNLPPGRGDANNKFSAEEQNAFGNKSEQKAALEEYLQSRDASLEEYLRSRDASLSKSSWTVENPTLMILNSCSPGQRAFEWPENGHGVFTHYLLEAMKLRRDTAESCFSYVYNKMIDKNCENRFWREQQPCKYVEGGEARLLPFRPDGERKEEAPGVSRAEIDALTGQMASLVDLVTQLRGELTKANQEKDDALNELQRVREQAEASRDEVNASARPTYVLNDSSSKIPAPSKPANIWAEDKARSAGTAQSLTVAGVKYRFRWCPAGTFMMGSNNGQDREKPVHEVCLTRGFWLLETPVTQLMWKSIMGENPSYHGGFLRSKDNWPVEYVSWNDCQNFFARLGRQYCNENTSGPALRFCFPTESQWEYAARAGENYEYSGSDNLKEVGWYTYNSGEKTHKVGEKAPNGWGLYDMSGNVWEWCSDWYGSYPNGTVTDPQGPDSGSYRVNRGGSWFNGASYCRCAYRACDDPEGSWNYVGFRLLLESVQ